MALTRSYLRGMGLTDEQISGIIEAHTDTVNALKDERDSFKESAGKLEEVEKELEKLKSNGGDWQKKYEKEHSDFEAYKTEQTEKANKMAIKEAYKNLLKSAGVSEKRIDTVLKVADLSKIELEDGKIKGSDELTKGIKEEWSDFITETKKDGAETHNPPAKDEDGVDLESMSMADYIAARKKK